MSPETERAHAEMGLYPIERLLPKLESGSKEIIPGKKVSIQTYGRMSHFPAAQLAPPVKEISILISEACSQLQTEVRARITTSGAPKLVSILVRIGRTSLMIHDEQRAMLNTDMVRQIERDLKAYIKLKDHDEALAVLQIQARTSIAATIPQIEAVEASYDRKRKKRGKY